MIRFSFSILICTFFAFIVFPSTDSLASEIISPSGKITASIDLRTVENDMLTVTVIPPPLCGKTFTYILPASAPGTYAQYDFGRFVVDFKAFDKKGNQLEVTRLNANEFSIGNPELLAKLEYRVNDTFDDPTDSLEVFNPGGTNFQKDTNFILNYEGIIGYFDGYKMLPYEVTIQKPTELYGATSLAKLEGVEDVMKAKNYDELVDNPAMYSIPDTLTYQQGNTTISIAVFSGTSQVSAQFVARVLKPITKAVERFFGTMPVDHYSFIMYFVNPSRRDLNRKGALGALEHNYCSLYFLAEMKDSNQLRGLISQTAAHEFLHILVPLHLHSEEIADFDFRSPKMSRHLWLYEGITEYFSMLAQVHDSLITEQQMIQNIRRKIFGQSFMARNPISLVELSTNVLQPEWQKLYPIIYEKGALLGLMLDIRLQELSKGKLDVLGLVTMLSKRFGEDKPFKDDELFDVIYASTYPEIKQFFDSLIIGSAPLPLDEYMSKIGLEYSPMKTVKAYNFGKFKINIDTITFRPVVIEADSTNLLQLQTGDIIRSVNGTKILINNDDDDNEILIWSKVMLPKDSTEVTITVLRNNKDITLSAIPISSERKERFYLKESPDATSEQIALRKRIFYQ
ncbi:MAG: hypothetical protein JST20_10200 [Bacteroidetes bacterium]|nr:hypothetical protein [Bacteroidota bacterium]